MDHWRAVLFSDKDRLGRVNIQSGVVQDTLVPVSLVLTMVNVGYSFGKGKNK